MQYLSIEKFGRAFLTVAISDIFKHWEPIKSQHERNRR
jgi:hypothetical protein